MIEKQCRVMWDGRKLSQSDPVLMVARRLLELLDAGRGGRVFLRTTAGDEDLGEVRPREKVIW
jgi:hypothetical protein